ncbi:MAG: biotin--[acetyl-CoA-carboxylase] ligase [Nitrospinota bacterium]|nr:biotin--[acetyl-CoA-carboxylase] ligase [Nitrospinota bacterium]
MSYSQQDQQWIQSQLQAVHIGKEIIIHDSVDSTNDIAKRMIGNPDKEGTVILANNQTQGKGRQGRHWHSEENVGIYLSTFLRTSLAPQKVAQIALVAGVALVHAINEFSRARAYLKWPNDILINGKKVAGILTEYSKNKAHSEVILGIGINVNHSHFPVPLQHIATSMAMENGEIFERLPLITFLLNRLDQEYLHFLEEGISPTIAQWNLNSDMFGKHVSLTKGTQTFLGTAMKLNEEGHLVILTEDDEEIAFHSGEIALIE